MERRKQGLDCERISFLAVNIETTAASQLKMNMIMHKGFITEGTTQ